MGLLTDPETAQSTGLPILLEPYLSHGPLGGTSAGGPERAAPSEAAATPCLGESTTATPIQRSVDVILQRSCAIRAARWSTRNSTNALWNEATSVASGRGISNMYLFPIEHGVILRLQVFTGGNRVAEF